MDDKLLSALIGALVVCLGWIITDYLARRRTEEDRRKQISLKHIESQIKELYGPLLGLIEHSEDVFNVAKRLIPNTLNDTRKNFPPFSADDSHVWRFFIEEYFIPIHQNIRNLLSSKTHLLEKDKMPLGLRTFLNYAADLECRHKLFLERNIDSSSIEGVEYPSDFKNEIEDTLNRLYSYQASLIGAKTNG